ncbi:MAG: TadE/TadG family type IV pilus assembly protein [Chloroflexi bacterium]|nr:TadE/TadG family type IV pilus assembly protein [Chloroflexota bacterium]
MIKQQRRFLDLGQSLVEVALFLPVFLILLGGVVEMGQMLITNNRVNTVTNTSARYGSEGGDDEGMVIVALNTITQTLPMDTDRWDIWTIRGIVNAEGTAIIEESWAFVHKYGDGNTNAFATINEVDVRQAVLDDLQRNADGEIDAGSQNRAKDIQFVGTLAIFDAESILGLNIALEDWYSVQALTVMRTYPATPNTNGCDGFPIAVEETDNRSLGAEGLPFPFPMSGGGNYYPSTLSQQPSLSDFPSNVPNVPLRSAQQGYVYKIQQGAGSGGFGWLQWNDDPPENALLQSLTWPGNSRDYTLENGTKFRGYQEPGDPNDRSMHIGDRIAADTGTVNSNPIRTVLQGHISGERTLRVLVWKRGVEGVDYGGTGNNQWYLITGFMIVRLHGYSLPPGNGGEGSWILAEFIRWDDSCGQVNELPGQ